MVRKGGTYRRPPPFYRPLVEMTPEKIQPKQLTMVLYQTGQTENGTERFRNRPKGANIGLKRAKIMFRIGGVTKGGVQIIKMEI